MQTCLICVGLGLADVFQNVVYRDRSYPAAAVVESLVPHISERRVERMRNVLRHRLTSVAFGVEDLHHSYNAAACVRTCEALGIQDIVALEDRERYPEPLGKSTARSGVTMYADRWVDFHRTHSQAEVFQWAHERGMIVMGTSPHAEMTVEEVPVDRPFLLLFGNERDGLHGDTSRSCDLMLRLPMFGFTESFNVSVSAGMILNQLTTRLRRRLSDTGRTGDMPESRQTALMARWCISSVRRPELIIERYLSRM